MLFLLRCPKCHNQMKYDSKGTILTKKRKRCVYCGKSFSVRSNIAKKCQKLPTKDGWHV